jgi:hypothetical protein
MCVPVRIPAGSFYKGNESEDTVETLGKMEMPGTWNICQEKGRESQ